MYILKLLMDFLPELWTVKCISTKKYYALPKLHSERLISLSRGLWSIGKYVKEVRKVNVHVLLRSPRKSKSYPVHLKFCERTLLLRLHNLRFQKSSIPLAESASICRSHYSSDDRCSHWIISAYSAFRRFRMACSISQGNRALTYGA